MAIAIITGEYPPKVGGVGDYSALLAARLSGMGEKVHVFAPGCPGPEPGDSKVVLHNLPDRFGPRTLLALQRGLSHERPDKLLVQYVPHAFGWKAMNLPFCIWLFSHRKTYPIWVMFHEVAFPMLYRQPLRHNVLGVVTRVMAAIVARAADRIFVAVPAWAHILRALAPRCREPVWLPVPSNIPVVQDRSQTQAIRGVYLDSEGILVGHFGTYGASIRGTLKQLVPVLLAAACNTKVLMLGNRGEPCRWELLRQYPSFAARVIAPGYLAPAELSRYVSACDLMVQPYPDGISTRRTSAMVALAHARPLVTTSGGLTEALWKSSKSVAVAPAGDVSELCWQTQRLIGDREARSHLGIAGKRLYEKCFSIERTISALAGNQEAANS